MCVFLYSIYMLFIYDTIEFKTVPIIGPSVEKLNPLVVLSYCRFKSIHCDHIATLFSQMRSKSHL